MDYGIVGHCLAYMYSEVVQTKSHQPRLNIQQNINLSIDRSLIAYSQL
jgi:hypothetical protein